MSSPLGLTTRIALDALYTKNHVIDGLGYDQVTDEEETSTSPITSPEYTGQYNSIFNGTKWYHRPSTSMGSFLLPTLHGGAPVRVDLPTSVSTSGKRHDPNSSKTNDVYNISTNSIIDYTNNLNLPALKLDPAHFVYLKDYGVYPNNRLIICRRFPAPVENDLTSYSGNSTGGPSHASAFPMKPLSTIVSWISDSAENFFSFDTSEEWVTGEKINNPVAELVGIFNDVIGKALPFNIGGEMSGTIGAVANLIPTGGISEALETAITNYFLGSEGTNGTNFNYDNLHKGNPNFMGQSAYRNINSITSTISIPVNVVYEMKFINGIDPTIAFMDVIQNLLRFSSSESIFYLSQAGSEKINSLMQKFKNGDWMAIVGDIVDVVIRAVTDLTNGLKNVANRVIEIGKNIANGQAISDAVFNEGKSLIITAMKTLSKTALARYRIEFNRIIPAMTGLPSAPWHVTLGNPKSPFFSSGDMIVSDSKVVFGNILGFNDLPTRIEFSFNIKSARNLGIQEIFDKFNTGAGRQYQRDNVKFGIDWNQGNILTDSEVANATGNDASNDGIPPNNTSPIVKSEMGGERSKFGINDMFGGPKILGTNIQMPSSRDGGTVSTA